MSEYKIQKVGAGNAEYDLQDYFSLKVKKIDGLAKCGAVKGVVKENFPESASADMYVNKVDGKVLYEETSFELTVIFTIDRYSNYLDFLDYLQGNEVYVKDTGRGIKARGWAIDAPDPTDNVESGGEYLETVIKFTNLYGNFEKI